MPKFDSTTILLRPVHNPTTDLWDDLLRQTRRPEHNTTENLIRKRMHWFLPAMVTGLLAALGLGRPGLWTDELATWGMATTPWSEFWPVLRYVDAVIAPYYGFMHLWVSIFGSSDIALRLPSLLAMAASAGLVGIIGNRLAGPQAGLLSGLVFAVLPSTSRFAAEARPYALTVLAACLATWLLVRAWERPAFGRWMAYAAAVAVLAALNMVAVLLLVAHAWIILAWHRAIWRQFLGAVVVAVLPVVPLLVFGAQQRHQVAYIGPVTFDSFARYSEVLFGGVLAAAVIIGISLFSLPLRLPSAVFAAWAAGPALALIAVSWELPMFLPRYLLFTTPGWALLAGSALARIRPLWSFVAVALVATLALPVQLQIRAPGGHDQATRQAAAVVAAGSQPGDGIVYADDEPIGAWTTRDAMNHYLAGARPADVLATQPPRTHGLLTAAECADVAKCLGTAPRIWVVRAGHLTDPLAGIGDGKHSALSGAYTVDQIWYPTGLTVALLIRQKGL